MPQTFYTEKEYKDMQSIVCVFERCFERFESHIRDIDEKSKNLKQRRENGMYPFIPLSPYEFTNTLSFVRTYLNNKRKYNGTFIDVGCGPGTKVILAHELGFKAHGIEYDLELVKIAKKICMKVFYDDSTIELGDALTYNFYDKYDVIYYYCPLSDRDKQIILEKKIEDDMKVGAILISFNKQDLTIEKDKRFKDINPSEHYRKIFQKIKK